MESKAELFAKHILSGQPTKYKGEKHIKLLFEVFGNGEGVAAFCAETWITESTFFLWVETHIEFKEAYRIAIKIGQRVWEESKGEIEFPRWSAIMRNRFGYGKTKIKLSKDKAPLTIVDDVLIGLEEGEITPQEATQVANLAVTKANLQNDKSDNQGNVIKETRESLAEKIDKIQKIIDYAKSDGNKSE
jgi:hypothetical protein